MGLPVGRRHTNQTRIIGLFDIQGSFNLANCLSGAAQAPLAVGAAGDVVTGTSSSFDGWGYVNLFGRESLDLLDTFAIPEAHDPAFATGFGDLTVHEVATDPLDASRAYLSYYSGGVRMIEIVCTNPADETTCELVEVGGYLGAEGNDVWGVEAFATVKPTYSRAIATMGSSSSGRKNRKDHAHRASSTPNT